MSDLKLYNTGAVRYKLGASALVVLGHLVSCFARDFSPAVAAQEAYLQLLSTLCALAAPEHSTLNPGTLIEDPSSAVLAPRCLWVHAGIPVTMKA